MQGGQTEGREIYCLPRELTGFVSTLSLAPGDLGWVQGVALAVTEGRVVEMQVRPLPGPQHL